MRTKYWLFLLLLSLPLTSFLCPASDTTGPNPCIDDLEFLLRDSVVNPGGVFFLEAPPGENHCHATYNLTWRYADHAKAVMDTSMPPLENVSEAFGPAGELSYFPHDLPKREINSHGEHQWVVTCSAGNKNSGNPSTKHSIAVSVPTVQENPKAADVMIHGGISYVPIAK
jgi:hypothetical protein